VIGEGDVAIADTWSVPTSALTITNVMPLTIVPMTLHAEWVISTPPSLLEAIGNSA
jgi:hypothetical protein